MERFHTQCYAKLVAEKITVSGELKNLNTQVATRRNDDVLVGQINLFADRLSKLMRAEDRIQHGGYGVCLTCGKPIPDDRLTVEPCAEECVHCPLKQRRS